MRRRAAARLLLLDPEGRVLLFRFVFTEGALAGMNYWGTPGGALEKGETFAEAARRELFEETGIAVETAGESVAELEFVLQTPDGGKIMAHEHYFVVRTPNQTLSRDHWTDSEKAVMRELRWWSAEELRATQDVVFPENLLDMLARQRR